MVAIPRDDAPPARTDLGKMVIGVEELNPELSHLSSTGVRKLMAAGKSKSVEERRAGMAAVRYYINIMIVPLKMMILPLKIMILPLKMMIFVTGLWGGGCGAAAVAVRGRLRRCMMIQFLSLLSNGKIADLVTRPVLRHSLTHAAVRSDNATTGETTRQLRYSGVCSGQIA